MQAIGSDTNIGITIATKGTGRIEFITTATSNQVIFAYGAASVLNSAFNFQGTGTGSVYTWPQGPGTVVLGGANSNITSLTGLTGVLQAPTSISDSSGNINLQFGYTASAVNYLQIANNATGAPPIIAAEGSDTNVNFSLYTKGDGVFILNSEALNIPIAFLSGTAYQHTTYFSFANTSASRTVTFQDASGTLCMDTSSSGSLTTAPPVSASSTLAVGTAYQNTLGYDIVLTVYLSVTAATTASILLGVGTTTTPTQQTIVSSLTTASTLIIPVTIYLPNNYYAKLSTSGTITQTISGQQAMAV